MHYYTLWAPISVSLLISLQARSRKAELADFTYSIWPRPRALYAQYRYTPHFRIRAAASTELAGAAARR